MTKVITNECRMQIFLLNGSMLSCKVGEWIDNSRISAYIIKKEDHEILIPITAIAKVVFEKQDEKELKNLKIVSRKITYHE